MIRGKIDTRQFTKALREYGRATKKDEADILNRAARNVAFRAAQFTPVASTSKIKHQLSKIIAVRTHTRKGKLLSKPKEVRVHTTLAYAIVAKRLNGQRVSNLKQRVTDMVNSRVKSTGYIRAGWGKAIEAFGGRATRINPRSKAAKGYGHRATMARLIATLGNNAKGAEKVGTKPLQQAVDFVARDMKAYAEQRLAKTSKQYSAK